MKKYAMMLMNPAFCPEKQKMVFLAGEIENLIVTVRTEQEALEKVVELADAGVGVLELCGAFGKDLAERMYQTAEGRLCIGYVIYPKEQIERLERYWEE